MKNGSIDFQNVRDHTVKENFSKQLFASFLLRITSYDIEKILLYIKHQTNHTKRRSNIKKSITKTPNQLTHSRPHFVETSPLC